eukprot:CAMPEP_0179360342 /NCGR_PEP_ID=MMETSP0797-20121207/79926_1 /TAXON_ID=47934 /ORGANISM="Dinophysis acuminata, Strain DAEP01" /LENGTH=154 /DNA_ID=CAMNT_0021075691 /DNA_START=322 /DNA_END=783 /DNA_ORIENTATION=+
MAVLANAAVLRRGKKQILALQVPVQHVLVVNVLQRQRRLREPPQDLRFGQGLPCLSCPVHPLVEVSAVSIVHDDGQRAVLRKAFAVANDVGVLEAGEHPHLVYGIAPLLFVHGAHVDGLHHIQFALDVMHQDRLPVAALPNIFDFGVSLAGSYW